MDLLPIETQCAGLDLYVSSVTAEQSIGFEETRAGLTKPAVRVGGGGDVGVWIMRWKREEEEKDDDEEEEESRRRRRRMSSVELCVGILNVFARVWFAMHTMLYGGILCYTVLCYALLIMLCYATLCYTMLCYAILGLGEGVYSSENLACMCVQEL